MIVEWKSGRSFRIYMQMALARGHCLRSSMMSPPVENSSAFNTIYFPEQYGLTPQFVMFIKDRSIPNVSRNPMLGLT